MARHKLPRKAKRSPLAAVGSGSGSGNGGIYNNNYSNQQPSAFFPDDEGPTNNGRGSGGSGAPLIVSGRSRYVVLGAAVVIFSSVLAALYHLAVTLPDQYSHAGGVLYAGQKSRSTSKQMAKSAKIKPKDTAAVTESEKVARWSSLASIGSGRFNANTENKWQRHMIEELATFESLYNGRAVERRGRTTPPPRYNDKRSAIEEIYEDDDAIGGARGGDEAKKPRSAQSEIEETLDQTRYPHNHALQSSSRTGLLPKRGRSVRRRYDILRKKLETEEEGKAESPSTNHTQT